MLYIQDIITLLPKLFNMDWNHGENKMYFNDNKHEINQMIDKMNKILIDKYFEAFQQSYQ